MQCCLLQKGENMRILAVGNTYNRRCNTNKVSRNFYNKATESDVFIKSEKNVSFGERRWRDSFDPLNAADTRLDEYARIFHKMDIYNIVAEKYQVGLLTSNTDEKRRVARERLLPRVEKVRREKQRLLERANELTKKALQGESNITEEKVKITKDFIIPLKLPDEQKGVILHKGILVYGTASNSDKNSFINWLSKEADTTGTAVINIDYDERNPEESFALFDTTLNKAKRYNNLTGFHSIIQINGIDKLLTDLNNDVSMDYINTFKNIAENADSSHSTLLIKTNLPIEDFDSAVIAPHRFPKKVNLKAGITPEEKEELERINKELKALEDDAGRASSYYYDVYYDNNDDDDWLSKEIAYRNGCPLWD